MKIWIFNHYAVGPSSSGGTRHFDMAKQLVKKGHQVTIFASSFNHQTLREEHFQNSNMTYSKDTYEGVEFVWVKTTSYHKNNYKRVLNMITYSWRALRIAKKQGDIPDVIIGSLVHPLAAYVGYLVSKKFNCLYYFEERDLWPQTLIDLGKMNANNPMIKILAKMELFLFKKAKRIIVLFDKAVNYVESRGIPRDRVLYIPNGFDESRTSNAISLSEDSQEVFIKLKDQITAVYTGAHGKANNLDVILDSAKLLEQQKSNVHFVLIGNGPEKTRLLNRVSSEKITNVTMMEPLQKEMIPKILDLADIGLLPLVDSPVFKWGISPNKLFDYMGAALPVLLICDLDGTPVELSNGGKVIKTDYVEEIVDFFQSVDKNHLKQLGENARKFVGEHHSWQVLSSKLEKQMLEDLK